MTTHDDRVAFYQNKGALSLVFECFTLDYSKMNGNVQMHL